MFITLDRVYKNAINKLTQIKFMNKNITSFYVNV